MPMMYLFFLGEKNVKNWQFIIKKICRIIEFELALFQRNINKLINYKLKKLIRP